MLENKLSYNSHISHDRADLWQKLLKYGVKPINEEGVATIYNGYNINQLQELLKEKEAQEENKKNTKVA